MKSATTFTTIAFWESKRRATTISGVSRRSSPRRTGTALLGCVLAWMISQALAATPAMAAPTSCDESCLRKTVDNYLSAMLAHDPKRLVVTSNVRFTENGVAIPLGEGLWATASGQIGYKIYVADPQAQSIGFIGTLTENGMKKVYFAMRIKLQGEKIAEVETTVGGRGAGIAALPRTQTATEARASFAELTSPNDRLSREKLIELSGKYFDALTQGDGRLAPFGPLCNRSENGMQVTSIQRGPDQGPTDCATGLSTMAPLSRAVDRRVVAVDETRNLVLWAANFEMTGLMTPQIKAWLKTAKPRDVEMMKQIYAPSSGPILELFRIRDGTIAEIEAVFNSNLSPYGLDSGWGSR